MQKCNMPSSKKQLSCRVSDETYDAVTKLVEAEGSPFRSTSEYLYTLVIKDLAEKENGGKAFISDIKEALLSPEVLDVIRAKLSSK